jgi:hypothetical protein
MAIFTGEDLTTGQPISTNGRFAIIAGRWVREFYDPSDPNSYQITATSTSDLAILTGSGDDTINLQHATGMTFINAGSGTNTITEGAGNVDINVAMSPNHAPTDDIITGFHTGDVVNFIGETALVAFERGNSWVFNAWNPAIPGSAIDVTIVGKPSDFSVVGMSLHG